MVAPYGNAFFFAPVEERMLCAEYAERIMRRLADVTVSHDQELSIALHSPSDFVETDPSPRGTFFALGGTRRRGDDAAMLAVKREYGYSIDASRPSAASSFGVPENNMNQLLHCIFLGADLAALPFVFQIDSLSPVIRKEARLVGHRFVRGYDVTFESPPGQVTLREFCTKRDCARGIWSALAPDARRRCYLSSVHHGSFLEESVYTDTRMCDAAYLDIISHVFSEILRAQIIIQKAMDSNMFLSVDSVIVFAREDDPFGVGVKLWPGPYATFSFRRHGTRLSVFPHAHYEDRFPIASSWTSFVGSVFLRGVSRLDGTTIADIADQCFARILKGARSIGGSQWHRVASEQIHSQAYDTLRIVYELALMSPVYHASQQYRSDVALFDTPLLSDALSLEEQASIYFAADDTGTPPPSYFKLLTSNLLLDALRSRHADLIVRVLKEPSGSSSMALLDLLKARDPAIVEVGKRFRKSLQRGSSSPAAPAYELDPGVEDLMPLMHTLIAQGAIGRIHQALVRSKELTWSPAELAKFRIGSGASGAVYRVTYGDSERVFAMKIQRRRAPIESPVHTNILDPLGNTRRMYRLDKSTTEFVIGALCSRDYTSGKSPHFVEFHRAYSSSHGVVAVMEQVDGTMLDADRIFRELIRRQVKNGVPRDECPTPAQLATNVVVQAIFALRYFRTRFGGQHNDAHLGNIFLKLCDATIFDGRQLRRTTHWRYVTEDGYEFRVPNLGILVKLADFGLSTVNYETLNEERVRICSKMTPFDGADSIIHSSLGKSFMRRIDAIMSQYSDNFECAAFLEAMRRGACSIFGDSQSDLDLLLFFRHLRMNANFQKLPIVYRQKLLQVRSGLSFDDYANEWDKLESETTTFTDLYYLLVRWVGKLGGKSSLVEIQLSLLHRQQPLPKFAEFSMKLMSEFFSKTPKRGKRSNRKTAQVAIGVPVGIPVAQ